MRKVFTVLVLLGVVLGFASEALAQNNFRSRQTGNWNDSNTWEEETSPGVWVNTANTPNSSSGVISIIGHEVTVTTNETGDQLSLSNSSSSKLIINANGIFTLNNGSGIDLNFNPPTRGSSNARVEVYGVFRASNEVSYNGINSTTFLVSNGGRFVFLNEVVAGVIPIINWQFGSTLEIAGYTNVPDDSPPAGLNQSFSHVVFNCANLQTEFFNLNGTLSSVQGDFIIQSTGNNGSLSISDFSSANINIGGDFIITGNSEVYLNFLEPVNYFIGGSLVLSSSRSVFFADEENIDLQINGNFEISGSGIYDFGGFTGSGNTNFYLEGDFTQSSGTIIGTGSGSKNLRFQGVNTVFSRSGGSIDALNFILESTSQLNLNTSAFTGSGNVFVSNGATLSIGSLASGGAIQNGTTAGNIRVSGTRTYQAGSTIEYNGLAAQVIGNGFPSSGVNLVVNNPAGVSMNAPLTISSGRSLTLNNGNLNIGANTLTLNGTVSSPGGGISGGPNSNLTIGGTGAFGTLAFAGTNELQNFTVNRTSSGNVTLGGDLTILGAFTQTAGNVTLNGNALTISGDYTRDGGSLILDNAASLLINGSGSLPASLAASGNLNTLTLNRASSTLEIGSSFTVENLNLLSGVINNTGTLSIANEGQIVREETGSIASAINPLGVYDLVYNVASNIGTGPELSTSASAIRNFSKSGSSTLSLSSNATVNGVLDLQNGTLNAASTTFGINGDIVSNAPATLTSATVVFGGNTTVAGSTALTFGNVTVNGTFSPGINFNVNGNLANNGTLNATAGTVTFGGTTAISGTQPVEFNNVLISGNLTASNTQQLRLNGVFTNNGTFNANNGTVAFNGTNSIAGTVPTFHNILISGSLTSPNLLPLSGGLTNNGSFAHNEGTVRFSGSGIRTISGSSKTDFWNVEIDGGGTINLNSQADLINVLTIAGSSTLDADGTGSGVLALKSSASRTARVAPVPSGSNITGNVTVERFMPAGRQWRYLAAPVIGATQAQWNDDFPIKATNPPSLYEYNESASGTVLNNGWVGLLYNSGAALANGRGYSVFIDNAAATTVSVRAPLRVGDFNPSISYTDSGTPSSDGWNLMGNPYASPLSWPALHSASSNLNATVSVRDAAGNTFRTWNAIAGTGDLTNGEIASGQGFWVQATGVGATLPIAESRKGGEANPSFFREERPVYDLFQIQLSRNGQSDKAYVVLDPEANMAFDPIKDGIKFDNTIFNLSTLSSEDLNLVFNFIPDDNCSLSSIRLNIYNITQSGNYEIRFGQLERMQGRNLRLIDKYTDTHWDVNGDDAYSFAIDKNNPATFGKNRFEVQVLLPDFELADEINFEIPNSFVCAEDQALIRVLSAQEGALFELLDTENQVLTSGITGNGMDLEIEIPTQFLQSGLNNFKLKAISPYCSDQNIIEEFQLQFSQLIAYEQNFNQVACLGSSHTIALPALSNAQSFNWYATESSQELLTNSNEPTYSISTLRANTVLYVAAVNSFGCEGARVKVEVNVAENLPAPSISNQTVCFGEELYFAVESPLENTIYQWFLADDLATPISEGQRLEIASLQATTEYVLVASNESACYEHEVSFSAILSEAISSVEVDVPAICVGESVSLNVSNPINGAVYNWYETLADATPLGTGSQIELSSVSEARTLFIEVTSPSGCIGERISIEIQPVELPALEVSQATAACDDENLRFTTNSLPAGSTVVWYASADATEVLSNETELIIGNGLYQQIWVQASNSNGCETDLILVNVSNIEELSIPSLSLTSFDICSGMNLSMEVSGGSINNSYRITNPEGEYIDFAGTLQVLEISAPISGEYTIQLLGNSGCLSEANSFEVSVDNIVEPVVTSLELCEPGLTTLSIENPIQGQTYHWYNSTDDNEPFANGTSIEVNIENGQSFFVVSQSNECTSSFVELNVIVNELGSPEIVFEQGILEVTNSQGANIQWYLNGTLIVGANATTILPTIAGTYKVVLSNGICTSEKEFVYSVLSAFESEGLLLYPNPSSDYLQVESQGHKLLGFKIFNALGVLYMERSFSQYQDGIEIDVRDLKGGVYFIQVETESMLLQKRFIKR